MAQGPEKQGLGEPRRSHGREDSPRPIRAGGAWRARAALGLAVAALAAGCSSARAQAQPPAWFVARSAELNRQGFPKLANVPNRVDANVNQAHWDGVREELDAAGAALRANPRSEAPPSAPAQAAAAAAFEADARAQIEATRQKH